MTDAKVPDRAALRDSILVGIDAIEALVSISDRYSVSDETLKRMRQSVTRLRAWLDSGLSDEEREVRMALWLGHGHKGVYGDDGEMQCAECMPHWDYKRQPLVDCIKAALGALRPIAEREP